jgi:hypothetical protein
MRRKGVVSAFGLVVLVVCGLFAGSALADSQARIVRLSDLDGDVQVDRGTGFEKAIRNMPITQGMTVKTLPGGLAEVEFENGSTVRLAPDSQVSLPRLSLSSSGDKQNTIDLQHGTAYFNIAKDKHADFEVVVGPEKAAIKDTTRFRADVDQDNAKVAVSKGELKFEGPSGEAKVDSNHTLTVDLRNGDRYALAKGIDPQPYDKWNQQESQFQSEYGAGSSVARSWPVYGLSDLNYYGGWYDVPGYGLMWQPASIGYGWDPFMNGAWMWYPGFGYTFVSSYPWGWMPYRYGSWAFVPGWGWGWQPSGFATWNVLPPIYNAPAGYVPPRRPSTGIANAHPTIVARTPAGASVAGVVTPARPGTGIPSRAVVPATGLRSGTPRAVSSNASRPVTGLPVHGQVVPVNPRTGTVDRGFNLGMTRPARIGSMGGVRSVGGIRSVSPSGGVRSMGHAGGFGAAGAHVSSGTSHASSGGSSPHH